MLKTGGAEKVSTAVLLATSVALSSYAGETGSNPASRTVVGVMETLAACSTLPAAKESCAMPSELVIVPPVSDVMTPVSVGGARAPSAEDASAGGPSVWLLAVVAEPSGTELLTWSPDPLAVVEVVPDSPDEVTAAAALLSSAVVTEEPVPAPPVWVSGEATGVGSM